MIHLLVTIGLFVVGAVAVFLFGVILLAALGAFIRLLEAMLQGLAEAIGRIAVFLFVRLPVHLWHGLVATIRIATTPRLPE